MAATGGMLPTTTLAPGAISRPGSGKAASVTQAYAHAAGSAGAPGAPAAPAQSQGDRVDLSEQGRMLGLALQFSAPLKDTPDVRPDKIEEARKLIESGELFSKDAIRQAARQVKDVLKEWQA